MLGLLMGAGYSSEEEEEGDLQGHGQEGRTERTLSNGKVELPVVHEAKKKVTRVQLSPASRERGDGSEGASDGQGASGHPCGAEVVKPPRLIHLPETNITLEELPPIKATQEVDLPQTAPSTPLVPLPQPGKVVSRSAGKRDREPKFVPYEPYKAAITHLVDPVRKRRSAPATNGRKEVSPDGQNLAATDGSPDDKGRAEGSDGQNRRRDPEAETSLREKEAEIERLREELTEKEKQIRIQTQINAEVKRLLVASVGEDIEAKVDYLTQDKARLSADIRQYASKISRDFEEKEQLSVESNLWKSKFLACSVIVDELARWKANLLHHSEATDHQVRLLLHEHSVLWTTLVDTYKLVARLRNAFDPLAPPLRTADAMSLLGLADQTLQVGQELKERLIGDSQLRNVMKKEQALPQQIETPAEEGLKELLSKPLGEGDSEYSELASLAVMGAAKNHMRKLGDKLTEPASGFKSCTHCLGTVKNV